MSAGHSASKIYKDMTGLRFIELGLVHMCITNIRQRDRSTNKGYRATFTKAQLERGIKGLKQANMAALKQISLYPQCTDSKECFYLVGPHTGKRYGGAPV